MNKFRSVAILRLIRLFIAVIVLCLPLLFFVGIRNGLTPPAQFLIDRQFLPQLLAVVSGHAAVAAILGLTGIIVVTLLFGRLYCSLLCPLGILQDVLSWLPRQLKWRKKRFHSLPALRVLRGAIVVLALTAIASGFLLPLLLLDPYSGFGRIAANIAAPLFVKLNNRCVEWLGAARFDWLYPREMPSLTLVVIIMAIVTLAILAVLSWYGGRLFCNSLCPVGAILSIFSRFSLFRLVIGGTCTSCGLCAGQCKAGCIDAKKRLLDFERCVMCLNCVAACRSGAFHFESRWRRKAVPGEETAPSDMGRRNFLLATGTTAALMIAAPPLLKNIKPKQIPVMPPGALNLRHFQNTCTACHLCVSSCPTKVIRPANLEYGLGGMMLPRLDFLRNMCEFNCTVCSNVCPNGALRPLTRAQKQITRIGQVSYRRQYCVIPIQKTDCGACAEHCPTGAVKMVPWEDGLTIPHTEVSICVGCGSCEYICPAKPKAIVVIGQEFQDQAQRPGAGKNNVSNSNDFPF